MNDYEINGRLLEASIILNCDVFELIHIKEVVKTRGFTAEYKEELKSFGFLIKDTFDETIMSITSENPIVTNGYVSSYGYALKKFVRTARKEGMSEENILKLTQRLPKSIQIKN